MSFFISKNLQDKIDLNTIDSQLSKQEYHDSNMTMSLKIDDVSFELIECQNKKDFLMEVVCPVNLFWILKESISKKKEISINIAANHMFTFNAENMIFKGFKKIDNFLLSVMIFIHNDKLRCLW